MICYRHDLVFSFGLTALFCVSAEAAPDFEREIAPILVKRCLECHNDHEVSGGLALTSAAKAKAGGDGGNVIVAGQVEQSVLLDRIANGEMPPEKQGKSQKLPDSEIKLLRSWIIGGAQWPKDRILDLYEATSDVRAGRDWWSLQPVATPKVPVPTNADRVANPIDAFVLARLEAEAMQPAPLADRRIVLRRLYLDVIGLPPTVEQTSAFLSDDSPNAWERVVDEVLNSPHYGERWARYWLDLVRFAETCGYERDQEKSFAWRYRDWVVQSLNDDKPYDQFVIEQLAGDEIADRSEQSVIATGFLRLGTWNDEPNDPNEYKYERLEDMVHATSSAFLGLTVKCARCHDHKFDPILQLDYYRMAASFWAGAIEPRDRKFLGGPSPEELGFENVFGWTDLSSKPNPLHLLKKGDPKRPLGEVTPAHLATIPVIHRKFEPPSEGGTTTQRRLQLARWITDLANPLTARVFVNRLWQHHFGEGLVRSSNNFGFRGDLPTHPELLDWLAADFVAGGWKIKRMHKLILMSSTYRQSSLHPNYEEYSEKDFINRLSWRANRRRLDAEALRDAMLFASGEIVLNVGGPSFKPTISPEALEGLSRKSSAWQASSPQDQLRRSLYIYSKRGLLPPIMTTFDFSDTTLPCGQRNVTTVPTQSLALLNNSFVHDRSKQLANRVVRSAGDDEATRIQHGWLAALGREPSGDELQLASQHLAIQKKRFAENQQQERESPGNWRAVKELTVRDGLTLHLRGDVGVELDATGRVERWLDSSGTGHNASQAEPERRPSVTMGQSGRPEIQFDGARRFLKLEGKLVETQACTMIAVVNDTGPAAHRGIVSNWNGNAGNSTTSLFLGLTGKNTVRFSDNFSAADAIADPAKPFVLTATNGSRGVQVFQNSRLVASRPDALASRNLDTAWVIGQQGNIDGEYWNGNIAEILVFDRELSEDDRLLATGYLLNRYKISIPVERSVADPAFLALASLCHVLLNSNEFLYVD